MAVTGKRPRHWAAEITDLPTLDARREMLKKVPEHLQDLVKKHLENTFLQRKHRS